ncbi:MAG: hypothetical protein DMG33_08055 [Acidobacteria bacterium]|nr:MAG: hypothetical protein DMG33_08055 [Acidobacteriota bacterium]
MLLESKTNSRFYPSLANPPIERQVAAQFPSSRPLAVNRQVRSAMMGDKICVEAPWGEKRSPK